MNVRQAVLILLIGCTLWVSGCTVNFPGAESLLPIGSPFVVRGTAVVLDNNGPCPAWIGDNGVTYHLFQSPRLDNDTFDRVTTPGVTSRLELETRSDVVLTCQIGTIAQVQNVLEIVE